MRESGRMRRKKKENLNNRMALIGITLVVLSLATAVHLKGLDLKKKDLNYQIREENLKAQVRGRGESGGAGTVPMSMSRRNNILRK